MKELLDAYKNGDMDVRTSLFLGYQHLRDEFMAIEMAEDEASSHDMQKGKPACSACRLWTLLLNKVVALLH